MNFNKVEQEAEVLAEQIRKIQTRPSRLSRRRRQLKAYRTVARNWYRNRKLDQRGDENLLPLYFIWTTTRSCNFLCSYCDDHTGKKYPLLDNKNVLKTEAALKLLSIMRTGLAAVYYAGGEPLLRKDLPEILEHASQLGYFPQTINSNGSLFDIRLLDPKWHQLLSHLDVVVISLDSLDLKKLVEMYDYKKPIDVIRNILCLNLLKDEYDFKLMINCVVTPATLSDAHDVMKFAKQHGIFLSVVPENSKAGVVREVLDAPEYQELTHKILNNLSQGGKYAGSNRFNEKFLNSTPINCRNTLKPHVDYDGNLFWPCKSTQNVDPIKINILEFNNVDEIWKFGSEKISATNFHGSGPNQCGGNCGWAQNYTTDAYLEGLRNPGGAIKELLGYVAR